MHNVLLLGSVQAGKTTFLKCLRSIYDTRLSVAKRISFRDRIRESICEKVLSILDEAWYSAHVTSDYVSNVRAITQMSWRNSKQILFDVLSTYQQYDYYFKHWDRISSYSYVPTDQDIIMYCEKYKILDYSFSIKDKSVHIVDTNGAREDRKKLITYFCDVSTVVFCASMIAYEQIVDGTNCMEDSIMLFDEIINSSYFSETKFILALTHVDRFQATQRNGKLGKLFPEYQGSSYETATLFVKSLYEKRNRAGKQLRVIMVNATDEYQTERTIIDLMNGTENTFKMLPFVYTKPEFKNYYQDVEIITQTKSKPLWVIPEIMLNGKKLDCNLRTRGRLLSPINVSH
jgi:GTPase SAR1 family protein